MPVAGFGECGRLQYWYQIAMARSQPSMPAEEITTAAYQRILSILGLQAKVPPLLAGYASERCHRGVCDAYASAPSDPYSPRYPPSVDGAMRAAPIEDVRRDGAPCAERTAYVPEWSAQVAHGGCI